MKTLPAAIIFDMDDTLAATGILWKRAEIKLLQALGHEWSVELSLQYKGMNALDVAATIHRLLQPAESKEFCQKKMRDELFLAFQEGPLEAMPGAQDCVRLLAPAVPMIVASGSPLPLIELTLERLNIRSGFQKLISSESVARGKPFPDVFLAAAREMNAAPAECLVFEDSFIGTQAACAAGMPSFVVPSSLPHEIQKIATRTYASLKEVTLADVRKAF